MFEANSARIVAAATEAAGRGTELAIFPELTLCGYPPKDLLDLREFVERCRESLEQIARAKVFDRIAAPIGFPERHYGPGTGLHNAVGLLHQGRVAAGGRKCLWPTYVVFDEARYFDPAQG